MTTFSHSHAIGFALEKEEAPGDSVWQGAVPIPGRREDEATSLDATAFAPGRGGSGRPRLQGAVVVHEPYRCSPAKPPRG
jgi:hypothetical protein